MGQELEVAQEKSINPFLPRTFEEVMRLAELMASSDLVPRDYKGKPGNCVVAMQMGSELGINSMQAIQNIAVINGRPSIWGDLGLAIVKSHKDFVSMVETSTGKGEAEVARCVIERKNQPTVTVEYGVNDAKTARLWGKEGPWKTSPSRMLQMRARWFAMRDQFPDALKGISAAEETSDCVVIDASPADRTPEPPYASPSRKKRETPAVVVEPQEPLDSPKEKSFLNPSEIEPAPIDSVSPEKKFISAEGAKAVQDIWNEKVRGANAEKVKEFAGDLRKKYGFGHFPEIRSKDLVDVIADIQEWSENG
jgi:hypothetical protein